MPVQRLTVTLPDYLLRDIDRRERNRSKFVTEAVRGELERRRLEDLRLSAENPHPESANLADAGFEDWAQALPDEDAESLVAPQAGVAIRWVPGQGWVELPE